MVDDVLAVLASTQYGLFSRAQVLKAGGEDEFIRRRLRMGWWVQQAPGVYGLRGWPDSWRRSLWLAHLDVGPGSVISHEAAASLHGFAMCKPGPVVLTVTHGDHERAAPWRVHQATDLRTDHVTDVDGLPVTTKARTLFDLSACTSRQLYERILDDAHVSGTCRIDEVRALYEALRRRGKRGMRMLRSVLDTRAPGHVPPASELERRLVRVLLEGGLPEPKRQYPLPWRDSVDERVDLAFPAQKVLIEADGRRWHSRMDQMAVDRRRDREALNHGWRPYRFVWDEIVRRPEAVCASVRDALHAPFWST
jgi:very-short-patch-repair endonuclease